MRVFERRVWRPQKFCSRKITPAANEGNGNPGLGEALGERMQRILTTEYRKAILQIKESVQLKFEARGIDIYEAVIEHGVRSPAEFAVWWRGRKRVEISQWLPHQVYSNCT